jgi:hypothetical protein
VACSNGAERRSALELADRVDRARLVAPSVRAGSIEALSRASCTGALACELRDVCVAALRLQLQVARSLDAQSALLRDLDADDDDGGRGLAASLDGTESDARAAEAASARCLELEARARR